MKTPAAQRVSDLLAALPTQYRVALGLAFADWSQELLTAPPPDKELKLESFAAEDAKLDGFPESVKLERLGITRRTYYRKRQKVRKELSAKVPTIRGESGTGAAVRSTHEPANTRDQAAAGAARGPARS